MAKLTKSQEKLHAQALELVELKRALTEDEKLFVLEHFQELSTASNSTHGAFFTPVGLARDLSLHVPDHAHQIIDLCAGIGGLSFGCRDLLRRWNGMPPREFVCVERNPEYVRIGKRILPEAQWICGDILDVPSMGLGWFDLAIANPPYGSIKRASNASGYNGRKFEYHTIAVAAQIADQGVFIIPQNSAPFTYSGKSFYTPDTGDREYQKFLQETGLTLEASCGIDTSYYSNDWHGVSPTVEIVTVDFPGRSATSDSERAASVVRTLRHTDTAITITSPQHSPEPANLTNTTAKREPITTTQHPQLTLWAKEDSPLHSLPTDPVTDPISALAAASQARNQTTAPEPTHNQTNAPDPGQSALSDPAPDVGI
ncbi:methyltransferase [Nocardia sp. 004]|uniref:methyltransferase n=1 Tax=Nocardia sp. 004 TaxID=3385978 RepID=UPI0039A1A4E3